MTGWRTVIFGLLLAIVPGALDYVGAVQWQTLGVSPGVAAIIGAVIIALRTMTSTAIGSSK